MIHFHLVFLIFIIIDAYISARQISLGLHAVPDWLKRLIIYSVPVLLILKSQHSSELVFLIILLNLFMSWLSLYNGLFNQFRGLHWFLPQKTNPIERFFAKNNSWELYLKQAFLHLLGWSAIVLEILIITEFLKFS